MELNALQQAVYEGAGETFEAKWDPVATPPAEARSALIVAVLTPHKKRGIIHSLLDVVDPNALTSQNEHPAYLVVSSSAPGKVAYTWVDDALQTGDEVLSKMCEIEHPTLGPWWMPGTVLDARDDTVRVHLLQLNVTQDSVVPAKGEDATCVRNSIASRTELTPGTPVLIEVSGELADVANLLPLRRTSLFETRSQRSSIVTNPAETQATVWVEAFVTSHNTRGGFDVTAKDGAVHANVQAESLRILRKADLAFEPVHRSLILTGHRVLVVEKATGQSWRGIIKGRNASGGYEVLYPDDGDYEKDVPASELFSPVLEPHGNGGGAEALEELLLRDARVAGSQCLPLACHRNNTAAVALLVQHAGRPFLGIGLRVKRTGSKAHPNSALVVSRVQDPGPCAGILQEGDEITTIAGNSVSSAAGPYYADYLAGVESAAVEIKFLRGNAPRKAQVTPAKNALDHTETYNQQTGLDVTQAEAIAELLVGDGARMPVSKAVQRGWNRVVSLLLEDPAVDVDAPYNGKPALSQCCFAGNCSIAEALLNRGASPNMHSYLGDTPLFAAACAPTWSSRLFLTELLLRHGAVPKGSRALPASFGAPVSNWSRGAVVAAETGDPPTWSLGRVLAKSGGAYTVAIDGVVHTGIPASSLRPSMWYKSADALVGGEEALVDRQEGPDVLTVVRSGSLRRVPLHEVADLPPEDASLKMCRLLCRDDTLPVVRQLPEYQAAGVVERYQRDSVLELVNSARAAEFLMDQCANAPGRQPVFVHPSYAAKHGWLRVLQQIRAVQPPVDWDDVDFEGMPPVAAAIVAERPAVLEFLLESGARPEGETNDGRGYRLLTVGTSQPIVYLSILYAKYTAATTDDGGALAFAVKLAKTEVVRWLLDNRSSVKSRYGQHEAFEWSCVEPSEAKEEILSHLMKAGAVPNMAEVVSAGYTHVLENLLVKNPAGALSDRAWETGNTPLMNAVLTENQRAFELLLTKSDIDASNDDGRNVLFMCCGLDNQRVGASLVKRLLEAGARVQASEALGYAASLGNYACAAEVLKSPLCNPNEKYSTMSPLEYADPNVAALLTTNAELEVTLADLAASGSDYFAAMEVALECGIGLEIDDIDDNFGRTALAWVCMHRADSSQTAEGPVLYRITSGDEPDDFMNQAPGTSSSDSEPRSPLVSPTEPEREEQYAGPVQRRVTWVAASGTFDAGVWRVTLPAAEPQAAGLNEPRRPSVTRRPQRVVMAPCSRVAPYELVDRHLQKGTTVLCRVEAGDNSFREAVVVDVIEPGVTYEVLCSGELHPRRAPGRELCPVSFVTQIMARKLLDRGADINAIDSVGKSVLHLSVEVGETDTVLFLLQRGAFVDSGAVVASAQKTNPYVFRVLTQRGGSVTESWNSKYPATVVCDRRVVGLILEQLLAIKDETAVPAAAIPNVADCARREWEEVVRELCDRWPGLVSVPGQGGISAVEAACSKGNINILRILVAAGASLTETNQLKESPLLVAARAGFAECVAYLAGKVSLLGTRALPAAAACENPDTARALAAGSTPEEVSAAAREEYRGRDVFSSCQTEDLALAMVDLLPDHVSDKHLLYFATCAWSHAVKAILGLPTFKPSIDGLRRVLDATTRAFAMFPSTEPGLPLTPDSTGDCIVVDMHTKEQWHGRIVGRVDHVREADLYLVEYAGDRTVHEVLRVEIHRAVDAEAHARRAERLWEVARDVISFSGPAASECLRAVGAFDPGQSLVRALQLCNRNGLALYFDGVQRGLSVLFDDRFAGLQVRLKQQLCLPREERSVEALQSLPEADRLECYLALHRNCKATVSSSSLLLACVQGWAGAVDEILRDSSTFAEAGTTEMVCTQARVALRKGDSATLTRLACIMESLILRRAWVSALDVDTVCSLRYFSKTELFDPSEEEVRSIMIHDQWVVSVQRQHLTLNMVGTAVRCFAKDVPLGLLHLLAYQNNEEALEYVLGRTEGEGCDRLDNEETGCLPRDYTTSTACHNILLKAEQARNRLPNLCDVDIVIGVQMHELEAEVTDMLVTFFYRHFCLQQSSEDAEGRLTKEKIKEEVERVGIGAFLWEPYDGGVFIVCNASLMRLEIEARKSMLAFVDTDENGDPTEFASGPRQFLVENMLNTRTGDLETWTCSCGKVNRLDDRSCRAEGCDCTQHGSAFTDRWLEHLVANHSIQKIFGVHDSAERDIVKAVWKWQPFCSLADFLTEPSHPPADTDHRYKQARRLNSYFGSKIAVYFLFVSFYISWLIPLIVSGLVFTGIQVYTLEVDNSVTVANGVWVILWASLFSQMWRRKSTEFSKCFGTRDLEKIAAPSGAFLVRNQHREQVPHPITGVLEPKIHWTERWARRALTFGITAAMISLVVIVMYANYRLRVFLDPDGEDTSMQIVSGVENALTVIFMDTVYKHVVSHLVDWENHRTAYEAERSRILKAFSFRFVNGFSGLTLTMLTATPPELLVQLASLLVTQGVLSAVKEKVLVALILQVRMKNLKTKRTLSDEREIVMINDSQKPVLGTTGMFEDYSMMILQFAYVISFATILPLAPVIAFVVATSELHTDLYKYLNLSQRRTPEKASGIGVWLAVIDAVTLLSIPFNILVIFRQGTAWKRHRWLRDVFATPDETCVAVSGALSLAIVLFALKMLVMKTISRTAGWVRDMELSQKFATLRRAAGQATEPVAKGEAGGPGPVLQTQLIEVTSRSAL